MCVCVCRQENIWQTAISHTHTHAVIGEWGNDNRSSINQNSWTLLLSARRDLRWLFDCCCCCCRCNCCKPVMKTPTQNKRFLSLVLLAVKCCQQNSFWPAAETTTNFFSIWKSSSNNRHFCRSFSISPYLFSLIPFVLLTTDWVYYGFFYSKTKEAVWWYWPTQWKGQPKVWVCVCISSLQQWQLRLTSLHYIFSNVLPFS